MKKGVYMKKTQIKLIEKARKEGASSDVFTLLSREDFTVRTLTDMYDMTKAGISVTDIEEVISLRNTYFSFYFGLELLKKGYAMEEIRKIEDIESGYYSVEKYSAARAFDGIIFEKAKNESDGSLRIAYARYYAEQDVQEYDANVIDFAIVNHIPIDVFKQEYAAYKDGRAWMYSHLPGFEHLLQGTAKRGSTHWEIKMSSMSSDEIKEFVDAIRKFYTKDYSTVTLNDKPFYSMDVTLSARAINIKLSYSPQTILHVLRENPVCSNNTRKHTELVAFFSGDVYVSKNNRLFPLSLKEVGRIYEKYGELGRQICDFLFTYTKEKLNASVMADLYRTLQADGFLNIPIAFSDCRDMHNCNQLLKYRWKNSSVINWNKADINVAYAIMKSLPIVRDIDQRRLLQHTKDKKLLPAAHIMTSKRSPQHGEIGFLNEYVATYSITDGISDYTFIDYCNLCKELHEKVSIGFKTYNKLIEAHDKASKRELNRLHRVSVPKDSQFNELRKLLPKNFEWIKGGKRLQQEGITMSHCVNSYYSHINSDVIAVYHLTMSDGYEATIEFIRMTNGKYGIIQMFGYHNEECPQEVRDYVHGFLKDSKKKGKDA